MFGTFAEESGHKDDVHGLLSQLLLQNLLICAAAKPF